MGSSYLDDDWVCAICLEGVCCKYVTTHECGNHTFHHDCLMRAMEHNPQCPICRYTSLPIPDEDDFGIFLLPPISTGLHDIRMWLESL